MTRRWWCPRITREKIERHAHRFALGVTVVVPAAQIVGFPSGRAAPGSYRREIELEREAHVFIGQHVCVFTFRWERSVPR